MPTNRNNQGTGFVNFNDVLKANAQSGANMGQKVAQGLESQANAVNSNLNQQQQDFQNKLGQSQQNWSNTSQLANQLATLGTNQDWSGIAGLQSPDFEKAGTDFNNYNYNGPTGLKDTSGLQSQAQSASQLGRLAGTSQGQKQLLGQFVGGRNYTPGFSSFDQALLSKYGQAPIYQAKQGLNNISNQIQSQSNAAQNSASSEKNLENNQKSDYTQKINNALSNPDKGTGILNIGDQNAKNSLDEIAKIRQYISGVDQQNNPINARDYSDISSNLSSLLGKYGVDTSKQFNYSQNGKDFNGNSYNDDFKTTLANIAGNIKAPSGGYLLDPNQTKAATNLASFTGNKFDPNQLVDQSKEYVNNLDQQNNLLRGSTIDAAHSFYDPKVNQLQSAINTWNSSNKGAAQNHALNTVLNSLGYPNLAKQDAGNSLQDLVNKQNTSYNNFNSTSSLENLINMLTGNSSVQKDVTFDPGSRSQV